MSETDTQELQVRRFLLGQLDEYEYRRIEERVMIDAEYQEHVRVVEEGLIEDYLDGVLSPADETAFEKHFVATARQHRKVMMARVLSTYTSRHAGHTPQSLMGRWSISQRIRSYPVIFAALAVVFVLVISLGIFEGVQLWRESSNRAAAAKQRSEIEHELAQVNSGTIQVPTFRLTLSPLNLRDAYETATVPMPFSAEIIEVRLILAGDVQLRYAAEISKIGTAERYSVAGLVPQPTENGRVVVIRIPSRLLTHGDYRISLHGAAKTTDAGQYQFQVGS